MTGPTLVVKPFGKDGVRLVFAGASEDGLSHIEVRAGPDDDWQLHGVPLAADSGVVTVKASASGPAAIMPRTASWRLRRDAEVSEPVCHTGGVQPRPRAAILALEDVEVAFNCLQWFGTIVVDFRPGEVAPRLCESILCADAAAASALALKDDAICIGAPSDGLEAVATRVRRNVYALAAAALDGLYARHPYLCGEPAERRPVMPNLVGDHLYVGHQGHALCIADWAGLVPLSGVFNLAAEKVDIGPARAMAASKAAASGTPCVCVEVRCSDGAPLTDKPGDGDRLLQVLPPATLRAVALAITTTITTTITITMTITMTMTMTITMTTRYCRPHSAPWPRRLAKGLSSYIVSRAARVLAALPRPTCSQRTRVGRCTTP